MIHKKYFWFLFAILSLSLYSCGPKIYDFKVEPETTPFEDSLKISWDVRGQPTIVKHEKKAFDDSTVKLLEVTLVVQKGGSEVSKTVQVNIIPNEGTNEIIINKERLSGDTLIVADEKNVKRWGNLYEVRSITSTYNRVLFIKHDGKSAQLIGSITESKELEGTPLEGMWEIRTLLSDSEKADNSLIPESLSINVNYQYKRR